jgi:hypothetical protein
MMNGEQIRIRKTKAVDYFKALSWYSPEETGIPLKFGRANGTRTGDGALPLHYRARWRVVTELTTSLAK